MALFPLNLFGLKSPNNCIVHYALISKFKSQRTILFFSCPTSATSKNRHHSTSHSSHLKCSAPFSGPCTHHAPFFFQAFALADPSATFISYFYNGIFLFFEPIQCHFSEMLSLTTLNKAIFSNKFSSWSCLFPL